MGGWEGDGVGGGGRWGAVGGLKHPFGLKEQCHVTQTGRINKGGQNCHEGLFGTPCSALQGHEMHPGGLTASVNNHL